jgi:pyrroline-5-carboxylate reductase
MLPTYFWFQWKELTKLGDPMGLSEQESSLAIHQTMKGALNLYFESGLSPDEVMDFIPVKPIGDYQPQIAGIYQDRLLGLFDKIKP